MFVISGRYDIVSEGNERHEYLKGLLATLQGQGDKRAVSQVIDTEFAIIQDIVEASKLQVKVSSSAETAFL